MAKGHRAIKVFGGKEYHYKMSFGTKSKAKRMADSYKRDGYSIRVLKDDGRYHVWAHKQHPAGRKGTSL